MLQSGLGGGVDPLLSNVLFLVSKLPYIRYFVPWREKIHVLRSFPLLGKKHLKDGYFDQGEKTLSVQAVPPCKITNQIAAFCTCFE